MVHGSREALPGEQITGAEFIYRPYGPGLMDHNYSCAVCRQAPAVLETWWGVLQPCWECQKAGYSTIQRVYKKDKLGAWRHSILVGIGAMAGAWFVLPGLRWLAFIFLFVGLGVHTFTLPEVHKK